MVKKIIKNTIKKHNLINADEHIVIGLSGGPDSVCLFSVLNELKEDLRITLHAVHVNHGFRPGAADEDQQYVEQLCAEKSVECTSFVYDCSAIAEQEKLSSEEAGRQVRYKSFLEVAEELIEQGIPACKIKIAVAQNADDQAETVLFRLLRGTGTDGLAGIAYRRKEQNIEVIRPLLDTKRKDIEAYCLEHNLNPRIDHTNLQPIYTRNKIRLELIPYLEEHFNNNIMETLGRLSCIASEDKEYLWQSAETAYKELEVSPGVFEQKGLAELAPAVRHRVVLKALQQQGLTQDVTFTHLEALDAVLKTDGESRTVEFPEGYRAAVRYGEVSFYRVDGDECFADKPGRDCHRNAVFRVKVLPIADIAAKGDASDEKAAKDGERANAFDTNRHDIASNSHGTAKIRHEAALKQDKTACQSAQFDADKVTALHGSAEPVLRTRREGDYLSISNGRKKIQDLFVDMKVPKEQRERVLVAAVGSEVLWLPVQVDKGVKKARYSSRCKLDMNTKKCLVLELDCEI